tara:strand:+ start:2993 stop:3796 length:804 start_codon:yes stop_codon:yes gene_type:complete
MNMAVTKINEGEVIAFDPSTVLEEFAGEGLEEVTAEDLAIPFLRVLAQLSPQVNKRDGAYVEGAEAGMIYNTVANEAYDGEKGILVVPCHYNRRFVEWQPRSSGGGFVGSYPIDGDMLKQTTKSDRGEDVLPNGNVLTNTAQFFVVLLHGDQQQKCCITMSSTQLKKARRWVALLAGFKAKRKDGSAFTQPSFSQIYRLRTVAESNDKGDWFGWDISHERALVLSPGHEEVDLLHECRDFKVAVADGAISPVETKGTGSSEKDEVPF